MTHFGIICPAAAGHLNPMLALGYELKQRNHRVTVINILDAQPKTVAAGLEFCAIGKEEFPAGTMAKTLSEIGKLEGLEAYKYSVKFFKEGCCLLLRELPEALTQLRIEALLIDQTSSGATTVADFLSIPFITVCCALVLNQEPGIPPFNTDWKYNPALWASLRNQLGYQLINTLAQPIRQVVTDYRKQWKLPEWSTLSDSLSKLAQLSQQPPSFEFPRKNLPQWFHFLGPFFNPASRESVSFPYEKLTGKPLIYASMGTVQNRLVEIFQTISNACADLEVQLVIALGGGNKPFAITNLAGSPIVVEYAPQLELLQRATLTITHAGMNTTLESLSYGVPMVAIPIANDQPGVAARIHYSGTGEMIPLNKLNVFRLKKAVYQVLTNPNYKKNALKIQDDINQCTKVSGAADIIEEVVSTGKPVFAKNN